MQKQVRRQKSVETPPMRRLAECTPLISHLLRLVHERVARTYRDDDRFL